MSRGLPKNQPAPARTAPSSLTPEERAKGMVGKVATFYPVKGCVVAGLPKAGAPARFTGQVIAATPAPALQPGNVPDYTLTVRGRTGRTATISLTENHASLFDTWAEANPQTT